MEEVKDMTQVEETSTQTPDLDFESLERAKGMDELRRHQMEWFKQNNKRKNRKVRLSRSWWGDMFLILFLVAFALFSAYPLVFAICNAFKPMDELFIFPPK
mgnify:CR=1 FL=1